MPRLIPKSRADIADRLAGLTAIAAGLAGLIYTAGVIQALTDGEVAAWFDTAQIVGGILILLGFLPLFYVMKARAGDAANDAWKGDGFTAVQFQRAGITAFVATVVGLIFLSMLNRLVLSRISAEVLADGVIGFALIAFSLSFFLQGFGDGE